jgi:hypothetical protein
MKLTNATGWLQQLSTMMMSLVALSIQISFHNVDAVLDDEIQCGSSITPSETGPVCFTNDNTFQCNAISDNCASTGFIHVKGTTSTCVGPDACFQLNIQFDDKDTNAQSMTCEGEAACSIMNVDFLNNQKTGTVICKGGTFSRPACVDFYVGGGCLFCEDMFSCYSVYVAENGDGSGPLVGYRRVFFQGYFGQGCPVSPTGGEAKSSFPCFSGANIVEVQDKGFATLDSIKIGDCVKTGVTHDGHAEFSRVISSMHVDHHAEVKYRQIFTSFSPTMPLEISDDHFLYLHDDKVVSARDVQVGDILKGDGTSGTVVTYIQNIQRQGLYAPATENGKIWVSGVTASSYISLINEEIVSPNWQAMLSHVALAPLRLACTMGNFSLCQRESHSVDGYSTNLSLLIVFGQYFMALMTSMQLLTLVVVSPLLFALVAEEMAFTHGIWVSIMTVGLVASFKMKTITKTAK